MTLSHFRQHQSAIQLHSSIQHAKCTHVQHAVLSNGGSHLFAEQADSTASRSTQKVHQPTYHPDHNHQQCMRAGGVAWSFETCWWVPLLFGVAGLILGLSVPLLDELARRTGSEQQQLLGELLQAAQLAQQQQAAKGTAPWVVQQRRAAAGAATATATAVQAYSAPHRSVICAGTTTQQRAHQLQTFWRQQCSSKGKGSAVKYSAAKNAIAHTPPHVRRWFAVAAQCLQVINYQGIFSMICCVASAAVL
jgi:hypothetical protein